MTTQQFLDHPAPRPYRITTSLGSITVMARTPADAIRTGLELAGPGAQFMSCLQEGDW